jgi:hypothetical protein
MILTERVSKIQGLEPQEFVAYVLLSDALSDIAENEFPDLAGKIADQEEDVVTVLKKLIKDNGLELEDYLDLGTARKLISALERHWEGKIDFQDFMTFDKDATIRLILQMAGNSLDVSDDPRVEKFLKSNSISIPEEAVGVSEKVFAKAYRAAQDLLGEDVRVTSQKSLVMETIDYERANMKREAVRVLWELHRRYYPKDREIDRMICYLEYLK